MTLARPLVSSDAQIPPFSAGVVVRAKVDNTVQMRGRVVGSNSNSKRHLETIYSARLAARRSACIGPFQPQDKFMRKGLSSSLFFRGEKATQEDTGAGI